MNENIREKNNELVKKILEWAFNEADVNAIKELRWRLVDILEFREKEAEIKSCGSKEDWIGKMADKITSKLKDE